MVWLSSLRVAWTAAGYILISSIGKDIAAHLRSLMRKGSWAGRGCVLCKTHWSTCWRRLRSKGQGDFERRFLYMRKATPTASSPLWNLPVVSPAGNWSPAQAHLASLTTAGPCDGLILSTFLSPVISSQHRGSHIRESKAVRTSPSSSLLKYAACTKLFPGKAERLHLGERAGKL